MAKRSTRRPPAEPAEIRLSRRQCRRILGKAGAKQASVGAAEELRDSIEALALDISRRAVVFADDVARVKVKRKDVKAAFEEFLDERHGSQTQTRQTFLLGEKIGPHSHPST
jgi:histone H3/H4